MSEFERNKQTFDGYTVLVTSWFDETKQSWRASAPRYTFVAGVSEISQTHYDSRPQAIEAVVTVLRLHFHRPGTLSDPAIFVVQK